MSVEMADTVSDILDCRVFDWLRFSARADTLSDVRDNRNRCVRPIAAAQDSAFVVVQLHVERGDDVASLVLTSGERRVS